MANSKEVFSELVNKIRLDESKDEIEAIVYLLMEDRFRLTRTEILAGKEMSMPADGQLEEIVSRINLQEPIQYILGEAWFFGRRFKVNPSVLIPRPETEEMVKKLISSAARQEGSILDIGTGSGCIAITLAKEMPEWKVSATDISEPSLMTARENANRYGAAVNFFRHNILSEEFPISGFDLVVSNPPYVTLGERIQMRENVGGFEPSLALFVSDEDPLLFYKAIARHAKQILRPGGKVTVEINERFGKTHPGFVLIELYTDHFAAAETRQISNQFRARFPIFPQKQQSDFSLDKAVGRLNDRFIMHFALEHEIPAVSYGDRVKILPGDIKNYPAS